MICREEAMKRSPRKLAQNYLLILLGSAAYALAFEWCYVPNGIAFGGLTGVGQLVHSMVPAIPVGTVVIVLNIPLFLLGGKLLGGHLLVSSLAAMALSSLFIDILAAGHAFAPMEPMLACVFGGVLLGASLGLIFLQGATTGGTDLIARLLKLRFAWLPMGRLLLLIDLAVLAAVAAVLRSLESALYGLVGLYISTLVMDAVLYGPDHAKVAYIVSDKPEEIARAITRELGRGATYLTGEGSWTGEKKKIVMCAFKQKEIVGVKEVVHRTDEGAFMIVCAAHEVLGEGFQSYHKESL